jgi:hypothetical protein
MRIPTALTHSNTMITPLNLQRDLARTSRSRCQAAPAETDRQVSRTRERVGPLLVGPLTRQHQPVSPIIAHRQIVILVGLRHHAAVELRTSNARTRREGRGDPSEEHHHTANYGYPDQRKEREDYDDVIKGGTTVARTIRPGNHLATAGSRAPHPVSLQVEHRCLHSRRCTSAG